jgi:hypothetical protein
MDEPAYHDACSAINPAPCVFEKALLAGGATCELARRRALAEREIVACTRPVARTNCLTLDELMRERSTFALRLPPPGTPLAHASSVKLQCGGLLGLQRALGAGHSDVHRIVVEAQLRWDSLLELPWMEIVQCIAAWQGRRRHRTRTNP